MNSVGISPTCYLAAETIVSSLLSQSVLFRTETPWLIAWVFLCL